ncbi:glycosyl hydrolase family 2 [Mucilaginibacter gracilis]|uniref:Glycosyl hydrolase family 2 n=1 Tax=Mucilaginibacter gracilis TaxID=423350 RepID=A0A495J6H2_9SPHI|nr:beta galactosidase jelly roll domain-containing protein [Mucilaginibacter gracilis]RKR83609.1 glycosyl hydrolase family 2 [Mucilaginibacter gracilis]
MKYIACLVFWSTLIAANGLLAQGGKIKQVKLSDFELQSTEVISATGAQLSVGAYHPDSKWYPVKVPSTVLTGLVANGVYPSPYQGLNNMIIPDASDEFNKLYNLQQFSYLPNKANPWRKPYWYRTSFKVAAADKGRNFQLIFKGINYRAAVWLNGHQIADSARMVGMFAEFNLQVSNYILPGAQNVLAVKIYPLDYPGLPAKEQLQALGPFYENGGPTGDIGKNVTMLCSVGWDWMPPVRDRNMGIWQPVYLRTTGAITIGRPKIKTDLPNQPNNGPAKLAVSFYLSNHSNVVDYGSVKFIITPQNFQGPAPIQYSQKITVPADSTINLYLDADRVKQLLVQNPHLWWPNNYGAANLYRIRLQYSNASGITDDTSFVFGIRTVGSKVDTVNNFVRRSFFVNGKKVNLVGGAWVPDMMVNRDSARYDAELHLCRNANVNLVRIWGGGVTPPDAFFDAADKYGLMIWSDFWITGDTQGEFKGSADWPLEGNVFVDNVVSTLYRIRNHPSLLVWTGGNEGHARKPLYDAMRNSIIELDGTRPFIPSSSGFAKLPAGWKGSWPDDRPSGVYSGGPYQWEDPKEYYKLADAAKDWVFKDETGLPSQPPYSSLQKNIPDLTWDKNLPYPLNNSWGYHDAATGAGRYDLYYNEMIARYGKPNNLKDFSIKMQLLNAIGYQGIFEAAGHKLNETGGVMLWKLNAALPSVIWQVYDWYLQPNAGYYFMQNACEPIHIQFNQNDSTVAIVNRTYHATGNLTAYADVYSTASKLVEHRTEKFNLSSTGVKELFSLSYVFPKVEGTAFVMLKIKDGAGNIISHNVYWLAPGNNYQDMATMPRVKLQVKVLKAGNTATEKKWIVSVSNTSKQVAFFINPQLISNGEELRPSYWSANYFSLAPHESVTVTVSAPLSVLKNKDAKITLNGWNVD